METEQKKYSREHLNPLGNWCNHDLHNPKFYEPPGQHGTRPDVLLSAQEGLEKFYWQPKEYLRRMVLARPSPRQQRTEAREAVSEVLGVILHYLDLATMRVGVPNIDCSFHSLSMRDIALRIGWRAKEDDTNPKTKHKGIRRVWRALKLLKETGYISISKRCEKLFNGEQAYRGLPAVRCVKTSLFHDLKVNIQKLELRRKSAASRLRKRYRIYLNKLDEALKKKGKQHIKALLSLVQLNKNLKPRRKVTMPKLTREQKALVILEAKLEAEGKLPNTS